MQSSYFKMVKNQLEGKDIIAQHNISGMGAS